ncbi:MAG: PilZ domain-containing protein [Vicinamibacteria bacterium]|nr:PilZ domain-containing protein [Vicinamibacteria bacterium]
MATSKRDPARRAAEAPRAGTQPPNDRRSSGMLRIPFVRRSHLEFEDGSTAEAFIVNINVLGAYIALDLMPELGRRVVCRFGLPGSENEVEARSVVAWQNPRQAHPVHSLPPGCGVRFERLSMKDRERIERLVRDYISQHATGGAKRKS